MRRLLFAVVLFAACNPTAVIPDADRARLDREIANQDRRLRFAMYEGAFFGDHTKLLLSDAPFTELDLLESPGGQPIPPPQPEKILPPGTLVRVKGIEFPTGWIIARRVVMTPRYHPWLELQVAFDDRPAVIVLPQTAGSYEDVKAWVERYLTTDDPTPRLDALPPAQKDAVLKKELVEGMGPQAVEMAWGQPEKKRVDRPAHTEEWSWPGAKRTALLQDDRLVKFSPR